MKFGLYTICEFSDDAPEPEGTVIYDELPPKIGTEVILSDKKPWIVTRFEEYNSTVYVKLKQKGTKMPNVNDLKNSQFLTKEDVEPAIEVTIKSYEEQNVEMEGKPERKKWTLFFRELDKPLVLNMTNGQRIEVVTGSADFDDWIGKKITLYNDKTVSFGGELTGGIRVYVKPEGIPDPKPTNSENEPHPDIQNPVQESKFCGDCGSPKSECSCIPF